MKQRILFLIESLSGGGAEKVLSTLVQHIDTSRFDVLVCCLTDKGKYVDAVKSSVRYKAILPDSSNLSGIAMWCYKIKYHLIYKILPMQWVYKFFIPKGFDVEVAFVEGFATKLLSASTNKHSKKMAWVHTDLINNHWISVVYKSIKQENKSYQQFNHIIGVSDQVCQSLNDLYNLDKRRILKIMNPIDSDQIKQLSLQPVTNPKSKKMRLVSVGRLTPIKGYLRLLQCIYQLKQANFSVELWLLGEGEERPILESYIQNHHLEDCVILWGFCSNPYAYMAQCDLFVCSSLSEGYSTAVTEALILGLPVVTTDCSGMQELLPDNTCGLITANSDEALYLGLKSVLSDPAKLENFKQQAQKRSQDFSLNNLMKPIKQLLAD